LLEPAIFYYNEAVQRYKQAIMLIPLVYQLNNSNSRCGSESSRERKYVGTKVP